MVDESLFASYDGALSANADLVQAAVAELVASSSGLSEGELVGIYARLVNQYGSYAAAVAVELYGQAREAYGAEGRYEPSMARPDNGGLLADDVRRSVASLPDVAVRRVMEYADETIARNAEADPAHPRWAFVPHAGACAWCVMLGSQGWAYSTERTARASRHSHCRCSVAVDFDVDNPTLAGYDPRAMQDAYADCRRAVEAQAEREWQQMSASQRKAYADATPKGRGAYDRFLRNRVAAEMATHDREWLRTGRVPDVEFESDKLRAEVERERPWEKMAANALARSGIPCMFVTDREEYRDAVTGQLKFIGLPDLKDGTELKSLISAKSVVAVDRQLRDAAHKRGLKCCVIDNQHGVLPDGDVRRAINEKMRKRKVSNVILITSEGHVERFMA